VRLSVIGVFGEVIEILTLPPGLVSYAKYRVAPRPIAIMTMMVSTAGLFTSCESLDVYNKKGAVMQCSNAVVLIWILQKYPKLV